MNETDTSETVTIEQAVAAGMAWLTSEQARELGYDLNRINLETLVISNPGRCVLAQASRPEYNYFTAPRPAEVMAEGEGWGSEAETWDLDHGFRVDYGGDWAGLRQEWVSAIETWRAAQES